ncbi:hypothetical protein MSM1_09370 [Mycobacterium sp. SM1]|uniref:hypothetical protein n=1 Tax=Mycobacterium sp. SM1 TaxID=2816243 RepID=UPI001BCAE4DF|nr:hypothetical protein [Mycobacterium sp. SM1]MBS4728540.1 hypothetical protein [Mycobacterium sp. SM1]
MTKYHCPRCGYETRCTRAAWPDRHPAAAVTAGLFALALLCMMLSVHPVAALAVIALASVGGAVWMLNGERQRRQALAARADYEHAALMAAPVRPLPQRQTHSLPWQMVRLLRTEPLRTGRHVGTQ